MGKNSAQRRSQIRDIMEASAAVDSPMAQEILGSFLSMLITLAQARHAFHKARKNSRKALSWCLRMVELLHIAWLDP